ncbi:MAG: hypothetical protein NTY77_01900 [Elusimicrobia bacterium]|nr:hypothetical protein [Elusimicrobiota bacterium]
MKKDELKKARRIIKTAPWKVASSARYRTSPHSYIIAHKSGPGWGWFADLIKAWGRRRTWHGHAYKYLIIDGEAFWVDFPALNRAAEDTLDPVEPVQDQLL